MADTQSYSNRLDKAFVQRTLFVAVVLIGALLLWAWRDVLMFAFAAVLIAIGLHGIADPLVERTRLRRNAALAVAALIVIGVLVGVFWLFGAQIQEQADYLTGRLPQAWQRFRETVSQTEGGRALIAELDRWPSTVASNGAITQVGGYTLSVVNALTTAFLVLFASAFFATSGDTYRRGLLMLFPRPARRALDAALCECASALKRWLGGTLISMAIVSIGVGAALWALGVPAFLALALIAGIAQFVPVVGPLLASAPGILLALTVSPQTALWAALAYFLISQLEGNLIYPMIQQRAVNLPPALVLLAIIAIGILLGPLGVLLATPMTVVASILITRLYVRGVLGEEPDAQA